MRQREILEGLAVQVIKVMVGIVVIIALITIALIITVIYYFSSFIEWVKSKYRSLRHGKKQE